VLSLLQILDVCLLAEALGVETRIGVGKHLGDLSRDLVALVAVADPVEQSGYAVILALVHLYLQVVFSHRPVSAVTFLI